MVSATTVVTTRDVDVFAVGVAVTSCQMRLGAYGGHFRLYVFVCVWRSVALSELWATLKPNKCGWQW